MGLSHSPSIVTDGLVLCLDAANRRSYPGSGTSWLDLSGNGNGCSLNNSPAFNSLNGGSILFDGANDYTNFGSILSDITSISIEIIFDRTGVKSEYYDTLLSNSRDCCGSYNGIQLQLNSATNEFCTLQLVLWNSDNYVSSWTDTHSPLNITGIGLNTWYHCIYTYDVSSTNYKGYLNGVLKSSTNKTNALNNNTSYSLNLGRRVIAQGSYHKGNISMLKIYNRALSANEVQRNYLATKSRFGL